MIRTEAAIITGTCYAQQQIAHNKYLPQFFVCNTLSDVNISNSNCTF